MTRDGEVKPSAGTTRNLLGGGAQRLSVVCDQFKLVDREFRLLPHLGHP